MHQSSSKKKLASNSKKSDKLFVCIALAQVNFFVHVHRMYRVISLAGREQQTYSYIMCRYEAASYTHIACFRPIDPTRYPKRHTDTLPKPDFNHAFTHAHVNLFL